MATRRGFLAMLGAAVPLASCGPALAPAADGFPVIEATIDGSVILMHAKRTAHGFVADIPRTGVLTAARVFLPDTIARVQASEPVCRGDTLYIDLRRPGGGGFHHALIARYPE